MSSTIKGGGGREFRGVLLSRLVILISIILVPIIIFLIFNLVGFTLWFSDDPVLNFWLISVLCPLVFSVSWLFFLILFASRFAETIDLMDKTVGIIPLRLKIFYGINALFILFVFVFPLITPVISILSFASLAWRLTTFKKEMWEDTGTSFLTKFTMVFFSLLPIFCTICIIPDYLDLPLFLWNTVWIPLTIYVYKFSYALCTALAIGSFLVLLAYRGVSEYEQLFTTPSESKSMMHVKIFEFIFFIFLFILALYDFAVVDFFYYLGFFIVVLVSIVNFFSGKAKMKKFKGHVFGYILAAIFMGSNFFLFNPELSEAISLWSLVALATIFITIFFYTFFTLED
ncbi:MAG: hypothetical protein ACTSYC_12155 [Promethearchaeota archaeon]